LSRFGLRRADGALYLGRDLEGEWWDRSGTDRYAACWPTREAAEAGLQAYRDREVERGAQPRVDAAVVDLDAAPVPAAEGDAR
jgi:hypothetical protein